MKLVLGIAAVSLVALSSAGPAAAAGCNGVVDQFRWGCAAWDNNNGPQYPHYKAPVRSAPPAAVRPQSGYSGNASGLISNRANGLIGNDSAGLVGNDGASLVGNDGASRRGR